MTFPELVFAHQPALFGMFLTIHFARRHVLSPCNCNNMNTSGNIQVLESCPNLTDVNFEGCNKITGEHTSNELS